jgi:hypothetical protein
MTPKEKARYLINKFNGLDNEYTSYELEGGFIDWNIAKQCALITVDVILKDVGAEDWLADELTKGNYWEQVRQEIIKL